MANLSVIFLIRRADNIRSSVHKRQDAPSDRATEARYKYASYRQGYADRAAYIYRCIAETLYQKRSFRCVIFVF
jgi:hypothetical protein